ncbi:MAG: hypothetical protein RLZZ385_2013 [Pseudomonadota bacterium]
MSGFKALWVEEAADGSFSARVMERQVAQLPEGDVLIDVHYSSLNYKDALSARGNKGVTRSYPHTPGIDAAGVVVDSRSADFKAGDKVIVIGYDLGMNTPGGFGQCIRVPANWIIRQPAGLSPRQAMILGTAGFTAALCVEKLLHQGLRPELGEVLVTGASGGVGSVAVALLAKLGFEVTASTGKPEQQGFLQRLGAAQCMARAELSQENSRPLLKERWAAAVDVVGGDTLVTILKSLKYGSSVAACGLVGSPSLPASVLPFILRGVNLLGVDSVNLPLPTKQLLWNKLAGDWRLPVLDAIGHDIGFDQLIESLDSVYHGKVAGRLVLDLRR